MTFAELLVKLGSDLSEGEREELRRYANKLAQAGDLVNSWVVPGSSMPFIRDLKAENIFIPSGEIRLGMNTPGDGFSGVRIGFPAFTYSGEDWNIAGINNDVLQVGMRASDGKLIAGGGDVTIDGQGVWITNQQASFGFEDTSNNRFNIYIYSDATDNLGLINNLVGKGVRQTIRMTNNDAPYIIWSEDPAQVNRTYMRVFDGVQGARVSIGTNAKIDFRTEGSAGGSTFMRTLETTTTPPNPGAGDSYHLYMKGDKLIIQFNDGGTVRYKYLDLTGTGVTWTHTTSAP